jgi:uncharacterized protein
MDFDTFTVVLLRKNPDGPSLSDEQALALQDGHLAHIAHLAELGHLAAAGPLRKEGYAGLSILLVPPEEALRLKQEDPAVKAGLFTLEAMSWEVPTGAVTFQRARFPHSVAEVIG